MPVCRASRHFCQECGAAIHLKHSEGEHIQFFTGNVDLVRKRNFSQKTRIFVAENAAASTPRPGENLIVPITVSELAEMPRERLRRACGERGLTKRGSPVVLRERLRKWIEENEAEETDEEAEMAMVGSETVGEGDTVQNQAPQMNSPPSESQPMEIDTLALSEQSERQLMDAEEEWDLLPSPPNENTVISASKGRKGADIIPSPRMKAITAGDLCGLVHGYGCNFSGVLVAIEAAAQRLSPESRHLGIADAEQTIVTVRVLESVFRSEELQIGDSIELSSVYTEKTTEGMILVVTLQSSISRNTDQQARGDESKGVRAAIDLSRYTWANGWVIPTYSDFLFESLQSSED